MSVLVFKYKDKEYKIVSKIESYIKYADMFNKYYKKVPDYQTNKKSCFDNYSQKDEIIEALKKAITFEIYEDNISIIYKLNTKELKEIKQNYLKEYNKFLKILYSYYKNDEYKETIKAYLLRFDLKYLIKDLNKIDRID